jgi:hypothetical protein
MASFEITEEDRLDWLFNAISEKVCQHGPKLLTRGMPALEANEALLDCITKLESRLQLAEKIIDNLYAYSVGMSFLAEEKIEPLVKEFWDAGE